MISTKRKTWKWNHRTYRNSKILKYFVYLLHIILVLSFLFCFYKQNKLQFITLKILSVFSVHGILQAIILEWVAIAFSRGFSLHMDWTLVSCIAGRFFAIWAIGKTATREATPMRSPHTTTENSPHSLQLEKTCAQQQRPTTAKINLKKKKKVPVQWLLF